jgi:hypothetical protein
VILLISGDKKKDLNSGAYINSRRLKMEATQRRIELNDIPYLNMGDHITLSAADAPAEVTGLVEPPVSDVLRFLQNKGLKDGEYVLEDIDVALKSGEGSLMGYYLVVNNSCRVVPCEFFTLPSGLEAKLVERKAQSPKPEPFVGMRNRIPLYGRDFPAYLITPEPSISPK